MKNYVVPNVRIYPTREDLYLWQDHKREWKRRGSHCYVSPSIQSFSSLTHLHLHHAMQVEKQRNKDEMQVIILVALWAARIKPVNYNVLENCDNHVNGMVEVILSYEIGRFISSCLRKERACTFESLYNWAIQFGRSTGITTWKKNCGKACRTLWKQLPKELRKGDKSSFGDIVYSTKDRDLTDVKKSLKEKADFYRSLRGKWASKMAFDAVSDYYFVTGTMC